METIARLLEGYQGFYRRYFASDDATYRELKDGQNPQVMVIACSDSRIDPAIVTQAEPGDIFVVRNVANLVPPYQPKPDSLHGVSAALEFGVCQLGVRHVVVMGHSGCAGIRALREGIAPPREERFSFIAPWVKVAEAAREQAAKQADPAAQQTCCEQEAIKLSLENLKTFPWIQSRMEAGTLALHGWYFRVEDGALQVLDAKTGSYRPA